MRTVAAAFALYAAFGFAASIWEGVLPGDRPLTQTDSAVVRLVTLLRENPVPLSVIAAGLPLEEPATLALRTRPGTSEGPFLERIGRALDRAVAETERYRDGPPPPVAPSVSTLPSGIAVIRSVYPAVRVSETVERERLTITLWACPDRLTALALFWIRRGGEDQSAGFYHPLNDSQGEMGYWYNDDVIYNRSLPKGDPNAGGEREGFIRGNVVVEASTWAYIHPSPERWPKDEWRAEGMAGGVAQEYRRLMRSLDALVLSEMGRKSH